MKLQSPVFASVHPIQFFCLALGIKQSRFGMFTPVGSLEKLFSWILTVSSFTIYSIYGYLAYYLLFLIKWNIQVSEGFLLWGCVLIPCVYKPMCIITKTTDAFSRPKKVSCFLVKTFRNATFPRLLLLIKTNYY
jgi:hypothetical protein